VKISFQCTNSKEIHQKTKSVTFKGLGPYLRERTGLGLWVWTWVIEMDSGMGWV
jgi:hypothetical protein